MGARIRLPIGRSLFFLCALAASLILLLPLRLMIGWLDLDMAGVTAREARGTVWLGRLSEARFGVIPVGDVSARLDPLPLLAGRARIELAGDDEAALKGAVTISRHRIGLDDVTARLPLGERLAPLPIAAIDLTDLSVHFRDGLCESAEGLVRATIEGAPGGLALPGGLSGAARCDSGALLLPLAGQSGMESLTVHIGVGGTYRADLKVQPATPVTRDALLGAGFTPVAGGVALAVSGGL